MNRNPTVFKNGKGIPGPKPLSSDTASLPSPLILRSTFCFYWRKAGRANIFPFSLSVHFFTCYTGNRQAWMGVGRSLICKKRESGSEQQRSCLFHGKGAEPSLSSRGGGHLALATTTDPADPASPSSVHPPHRHEPHLAGIRVLCSVQLASALRGSPCWCWISLLERWRNALKRHFSGQDAGG